MPDIYDIAIIGGGPAGTSAAITATRAGAQVLLLERGSFPRQKVCGEFVSSESLQLLQSLLAGMGSEADELLQNAVQIRSARTFVDGQMIETEIAPPAFSIPRYDMDAALWRAAQALGVDSKQQVTIQRIQRNGHFTLHEAAGGEPFSARAIINATGRWSNFKAATLKVPEGPKWIGLKGHFAEPNAIRTLDLHFFNGGYCGISPIGKDQVNACAMLRADIAKTLRQVFKCESRMAARSRNWDRATEEVSTAPLVFHPPAPVADSVLLAGDAAGFIDPFVGDGISMALHSGAMAAAALVRNGYDLERAAAQYQDEYRRRLLPAFNNAARIRKLTSLPAYVRWPAVKMIKMAGISEFLVKKTRAGVVE